MPLAVPCNIGFGLPDGFHVFLPPMLRRQPNAGAHLPPKAAARHERRLEAVRCSAWFGGVGCPPTAPPQAHRACPSLRKTTRALAWTCLLGAAGARVTVQFFTNDPP